MNSSVRKPNKDIHGNTETKKNEKETYEKIDQNGIFCSTVCQIIFKCEGKHIKKRPSLYIVRMFHILKNV